MPAAPPAPVPVDGQQTPPSPPPPRRPVLGPLRPLVLRLHFYAGVLIAPFLLVAAVTGLLYAGSYSAEKLVYADELTVPVGKRELPVAQQVAAARKAHPEGTVSAVRPSAEDGATTRVLLAGVPGVHPDRTLAVFVNPYTGEVRGSLEQYGSSGALPLRTWVSALHRDLHLGEPGRLYSEIAASWLWVIAGGGLVLWYGRRRARRKVRGTTGRRRTLSLHGTVGVWTAAGLVFLSATGLTWSTYAGQSIGDLREALGQTTPAVSTSLAAAGDTDAPAAGDHAEHGGGTADGAGRGSGADVGLDAVLASARERGVSGPVEVAVPADDSTAYVVKELRPGGPDSAAVDPATGKVVDVLKFKDYPVLAKLTRWGIDAHSGTLFGLANQLLLAGIALGLVLLIVWGYRMWWQRGRGSAFGRPLPRGAWQHVPPFVLVPLMAAVAVLGYFVPLLGIPLVAFLAVDIVLGEVAHRRGKRTYGPVGGAVAPGEESGATATREP